MQKTFIYGQNNLEDLSKSLIYTYGKYKKWALRGQMGTGKTTLVKSIIKQLECHDEGSSPTFTLVNQYESKSKGAVYHIDLYRLNTIQDVFNAGILDIIDSDHYCFVEWPELIEEYMDENWLQLDIETLDEGVRCLRVLQK